MDASHSRPQGNDSSDQLSVLDLQFYPELDRLVALRPLNAETVVLTIRPAALIDFEQHYKLNVVYGAFLDQAKARNVALVVDISAFESFAESDPERLLRGNLLATLAVHPKSRLAGAGQGISARREFAPGSYFGDRVFPSLDQALEGLPKDDSHGSTQLCLELREAVQSAYLEYREQLEEQRSKRERHKEPSIKAEDLYEAQSLHGFRIIKCSEIGENLSDWKLYRLFDLLLHEVRCAENGVVVVLPEQGNVCDLGLNKIISTLTAARKAGLGAALVAEPLSRCDVDLEKKGLHVAKLFDIFPDLQSALRTLS